LPGRLQRRAHYAVVRWNVADDQYSIYCFADRCDCDWGAALPSFRRLTLAPVAEHFAMQAGLLF